MFTFALRFFMREWRSGSLNMIIMGVVTAITCVTAVGFFSDRVMQGIQWQSSKLLGADIVVQTSYPLQPSWLEKIKNLGLQQSTSLRFSSVVVARDIFQLSNIRAVDSAYPLKGELKIQRQGKTEKVRTGPPVGEIWLEPRLLAILESQLGDSLEVGEKSLRISALLLSDSLEGQNIFSFSPKILMSRKDVEATGIVQPGSRIQYNYYLAGNEQAVSKMRTWGKENLAENQHLISAGDNSVALRGTLDKAWRYLGLASLLSVILGGIAILLAARRYSERHFDSSAILRCLGLKQSQLLQLHLWVLLLVSLSASLLGCVLGYLAHNGLIYLLADLLPEQLPQPGLKSLWAGLLIGVLTVIACALPAVLRIKNVSALRVLRRELSPLPINAWLSYAFALLVLIFMMWWYSHDLKQVILIVAAIFASFLVLLALAQWLFLVLGKMRYRFHGSIKFSVSSLLRYKAINLLQISAFALVLMVMMLVLLLRTDLLENWQQQLPEKTPNTFVINIQPDEVAGMEQFFVAQKIAHKGFFPLVRGRLVEINGKEAKQAVKASVREHNALRRELNLSWLEQIQPGNRITDGVWWKSTDSKKNWCSVEAGLARRFGLEIGDQLTFQIAEEKLSVEIKNFRKVKWDSFQPNFYVLFPLDVLQKYPHTLMSSFYLGAEDKLLLNKLLEQFPTLTLIEVDKVINEVKKVVDQLILAIEYILFLILLAGLAVLYAGLQMSMDERLENILILRILGARKHFLQETLWYELMFLGLLSALLALLATELVTFLLYEQVLDLDWHWHGFLWWSVPPASMLLIAAIGLSFSKKISDRVPMENLISLQH